MHVSASDPKIMVFNKLNTALPNDSLNAQVWDLSMTQRNRMQHRCNMSLPANPVNPVNPVNQAIKPVNNIGTKVGMSIGKHGQVGGVVNRKNEE